MDDSESSTSKMETGQSDDNAVNVSGENKTPSPQNGKDDEKENGMCLFKDRAS